MIKFTIVSFCALTLRESGAIPYALVYPDFPHLRTFDHGNGATSYQNVNVQNFGSVPIPKDLRVDDGHEYLSRAHTRVEYLEPSNDESDAQIFVLELENYIDDDENPERGSLEVFEEPDDPGTLLEPQENDSSHYENYDREIDYEYR